MLCRNCNYILSGEEDFCPHCGQSCKASAEKATSGKEPQTPCPQLPEDSIFSCCDCEQQPPAPTKKEKKRRGGAIAIITLLIVILVSTAVFTLAQGFFPELALSALITTRQPTDLYAQSTTDTEETFPAEEGVILPSVSFKPTAFICAASKSVSLRKGPDNSYAPLCLINYGTSLQVIGADTKESPWCYCYVPSLDIYGWLSPSYLTDTSELPKNEPEPETTAVTKAKAEDTDYKVRVTAEKGLYLRTGPGTDFDAICVIAHSQLLTVITENNQSSDWLYVSYGDKKGYVNSGYVTKT